MSRTWKRNEVKVFDVCEFDVYEIVVEMLLPSGFFPEDFALKATNFYFPKHDFAPSNPLIAGGEQFALQVLAVFDSDLFAKMGLAALGQGEGEVALNARLGVRCTSLAPTGISL